MTHSGVSSCPVGRSQIGGDRIGPQTQARLHLSNQCWCKEWTSCQFVECHQWPTVSLDASGLDLDTGPQKQSAFLPFSNPLGQWWSALAITMHSSQLKIACGHCTSLLQLEKQHVMTSVTGRAGARWGSAERWGGDGAGRGSGQGREGGLGWGRAGLDLDQSCACPTSACGRFRLGSQPKLRTRARPHTVNLARSWVQCFHQLRILSRFKEQGHPRRKVGELQLKSSRPKTKELFDFEPRVWG